MLTALLKISTMSQLTIDADVMHHMPMMESSIVTAINLNANVVLELDIPIIIDI